MDSADGSTAETGLTIANTDIRLSKNGANLAAKNSGGGTHDELGYYTITLDATDTNTVGRLQIMCTMSGALPVYHEYQVLEEAVFDNLFASSAPGPLAANSNGSGLTEAGGTGDHLTALPWNSSWDAEVQSECTDALNAYDPPTRAELTSDISGLNDLSQADIRTAVGLASANLDTQLGAIDGNVDSVLEDTGTTLPATLSTIDGVVDAIKVTTDKLDDTLELDSTVYRFTENALEQAPSGGGGSGATAQEVWEYATRTLTAGTNLNDLSEADVRSAVGLASANLDTQLGALPTAAENRAEMDSNSTQLAAIVADTSELQADWANGGRLDLILDARASQSSVNALNDLSAAEVRSALGLASANLDTQLSGIQSTADAIETDTQDIQSRIPDALVSGSIKANITHVIGDAVQESSSKETNWGGTP